MFRALEDHVVFGSRQTPWRVPGTSIWIASARKALSRVAVSETGLPNLVSMMRLTSASICSQMTIRSSRIACRTASSGALPKRNAEIQTPESRTTNNSSPTRCSALSPGFVNESFYVFLGVRGFRQSRTKGFQLGVELAQTIQAKAILKHVAHRAVFGARQPLHFTRYRVGKADNEVLSLRRQFAHILIMPPKCRFVSQAQAPAASQSPGRDRAAAHRLRARSCR